MSKKNGSKQEKGKNGKWKGFVNVPLSTTDTLDVIEHALGERSLGETLLELVSDGYKLSVSPLRDGTGFAVSLTGREGTGENDGYTMTTFAGTPERGIMAAWYKTYVICEGEGWARPDVEEGLEI